MYTSEIENRRHRSLLEQISANRPRQVADVDVVKIEFAGGRICGGRNSTALNSDVKQLEPDFFLKTGRQQQLTRQLITARVQVIAASPTRIRHALLRNVYMVTTLARSTIARPPARIVVVGGST